MSPPGLLLGFVLSLLLNPSLGISHPLFPEYVTFDGFLHPLPLG
jgi:hypothetical protein